MSSTCPAHCLPGQKKEEEFLGTFSHHRYSLIVVICLLFDHKRTSSLEVLRTWHAGLHLQMQWMPHQSICHRHGWLDTLDADILLPGFHQLSQLRLLENRKAKCDHILFVCCSTSSLYPRCRHTRWMLTTRMVYFWVLGTLTWTLLRRGYSLHPLWTCGCTQFQKTWPEKRK